MQCIVPVVAAVWFKREKRVAHFGVDVGTHPTVPHLRAVPLLLTGPTLTLWVPGYQPAAAQPAPSLWGSQLPRAAGQAGQSCAALLFCKVISSCYSQEKVFSFRNKSPGSLVVVCLSRCPFG